MVDACVSEKQCYLSLFSAFPSGNWNRTEKENKNNEKEKEGKLLSG